VRACCWVTPPPPRTHTLATRLCSTLEVSSVRPPAGLQVVLVGDLNIASGPGDVHSSMDWQGMYHPSELSALEGLMGPEGSGLTDAWRHTHPHTTDVYTVWEERTSARAFNRVRWGVGDACMWGHGGGGAGCGHRLNQCQDAGSHHCIGLVLPGHL
jgi:hypothetical protein